MSLKKLTLLVFALLSTSLVNIVNTNVSAASINRAHDYFTSETEGKTNVNHEISFQIPSGGHTIVPTDYIRIYLTNYSSVTAPTSGGGWSGIPTFGTSGTIAYVTGVSASPEDWITIGGITATNPTGGDSFLVSIDVTSDLAGTIVYDSTLVSPVVLQSSNTASVTIPFPTATLNLSGYSFPNGFLTIKFNSDTVGTTAINADGTFTKQILGIEPDNYIVTITAQDPESGSAVPIVFNQTFLTGVEYNIFNIVTSPSVYMPDTQINRGEDIYVRGYATPNAQIQVVIDGPTQAQRTVQVGSDGKWELSQNTNFWNLGQFTLTTKQIVNDTYQSEYTNVLNFVLQTNQSAITPPKVKSNIPQDEWTNQRNIEVSWDKIPAAIGYSYSFSKDPNAAFPYKNIGTQTSFKTTVNEGGIYYFKVAALDNGGNWSEIAIYILKIDILEPTILRIDLTVPSQVLGANTENEPEIIKLDSYTFVPKVLIDSIDDFSGVSYWEVSIDDGDYIDFEDQIGELNPGFHNLKLRVFDNAQNFAEEEITIKIEDFPPPSIIIPESNSEKGISEVFEVVGEGEPGSLVRILINGEVIAETIVGEDGLYAVEITAPNKIGVYTLSAVQLSSGGVRSLESNKVSIVVGSGFFEVAGVAVPYYQIIICLASLIVLGAIVLIIFKKRKKEDPPMPDITSKK